MRAGWGGCGGWWLHAARAAIARPTCPARTIHSPLPASPHPPPTDQQQALLEEGNTLQRLTAEKELLSGTLKYLAAQAALQSVGKSIGGSVDEPGSSSGPD